MSPSSFPPPCGTARSRSLVCVWSVAALLAAGSSACRSRSRAQALSATLSIPAYVEAAKPGVSPTFEFPVLEVYNGEGLLIYRHHDVTRNSAMLRGLPANAKLMQPESSAPRLAHILESVPKFKPERQAVMALHQPVVLSVDMDSCGECRIQSRVIDGFRERLLEQSVSVLEIHVSPPVN